MRKTNVFYTGSRGLIVIKAGQRCHGGSVAAPRTGGLVGWTRFAGIAEAKQTFWRPGQM